MDKEITSLEEYYVTLDTYRGTCPHKIKDLHLRIHSHVILRAHVLYLSERDTDHLYGCYAHFLNLGDITYLALFVDIIDLKRFFLTGERYIILERIVGNGIMDVLEFLVENGLSINVRYRYGKTMLIQAALNNQRTVFDFLLHKGADPTLISDVGNDALLNVVRHCDVSFLDMLIIHGVNVILERRCGVSIAYHAAIRGDHQIIQRLVDMNVSFNVPHCMTEFLNTNCRLGTLLECKPTLQLLRRAGATEASPEIIQRASYTMEQLLETMKIE